MNSMAGHRRLNSGGRFGIAAVVLLNLVAFMHARALTHFAPGGQPLAHPEAMSLIDKVRTVVIGVTVNDLARLDLGCPPLLQSVCDSSGGDYPAVLQCRRVVGSRCDDAKGAPARHVPGCTLSGQRHLRLVLLGG